MSKSRKIITIEDKQKYAHVMDACSEFNISESKLVAEIEKDLKTSLRDKLPYIDEHPTHPTPAYLAANQIGIDKRVVLLYLPATQTEKAREFVAINPTYTRFGENHLNPKDDFHISTFFADQLRFSGRCYAAKIHHDIG